MPREFQRMNIKLLLNGANQKLPTISTTPNLDAEVLLSAALQVSRSFLYAYPEKELTTAQANKFTHLLKRRLQGEPIAYILGKQEFWSLEFKVNSQVLIPRPETELLVELALKKITQQSATVADLGTGSGAIACILAKERPQWQISATDISQAALKVARFNAKKYKLTNIKFYCGDWCDALPDGKLDAIIANPPYIAPDDVHLTQATLKFEPLTALSSKHDGLKDLATIIKQAAAKLQPSGIIMLEHGFAQAAAVKQLLQQAGFSKIATYSDLAGKDRVTLGYAESITHKSRS